MSKKGNRTLAVTLLVVRLVAFASWPDLFSDKLLGVTFAITSFEYENLIRENQVDIKEQMDKNGGLFADLLF